MSNFAQRSRARMWLLVYLWLLVAGACAALWVIASGRMPAARLCFALDVCCGIQIAAGALVVALVMRLFFVSQARLLVRPLLILALGGTVVAMLGELAGASDSGQVVRAAVGGWTYGSVLAGALWTLLIYVAMLTAEFADESLWGERLVNSRFPDVVQIATLTTAAIITNFQQFSIARETLERMNSLSPVWAMEFTEQFVFVASIGAALAALLLASHRAGTALGRALPAELVNAIRAGLLLLLVFYLGLRISNITGSAFRRLSSSMPELALLAVELTALITAIIWLSRREDQTRSFQLYGGPVAVLVWLIASRLNTTITAISEFGPGYLPHWTDVSLAYCIVAIGVAGFVLASRHLAVFPPLLNDWYEYLPFSTREDRSVPVRRN